MRLSLLASALLITAGLQAMAADRTFTIVTNTAMVDHWPSSDTFIGTADDVTSNAVSTYGKSSPNAYGTYSYIVTSFGLSTAPDPLLFGVYDTATFVLGAATIDASAFLTNDIPLIKSVQFSGTELFPGHGAYQVVMTHPRDGTYTHQGSAFTFSSHFDFQGTFVGGTAVATNADANGLVVVLDAANFEAPDLGGVPNDLANYLRTTAIPLAKTSNANGLLCGTMNLDTTGSVQGVPGDTGFFPPLKCYATVLALDLSSTSVVGELRITTVQLTPSGVKLQWTPLPGRTYSVEAAAGLGSSFTTLATNLSQTEYLDSTVKTEQARFYRISVP